MNRVLVFQCEDNLMDFYEIGNRISEALSSSLIQQGYKLIEDTRYDPDWPIRVQKEGREFIVLMVNLKISPSRWRISLEDLEYKFLDDIELQTQINPIIQEVVNKFPNISDIVWYENFDFLKYE